MDGLVDDDKVGRDDGIPEGTFDVEMVGIPLWCTVGSSVGVSVGFKVGRLVGESVGVVVGPSVGVPVGFEVGRLVGGTVGIVVGFSVGLLVGWSVGVFEGDFVGSSVGFIVGKFVGGSVNKIDGELVTCFMIRPENFDETNEIVGGLEEICSLSIDPVCMEVGVDVGMLVTVIVFELFLSFVGIVVAFSVSFFMDVLGVEDSSKTSRNERDFCIDDMECCLCCFNFLASINLGRFHWWYLVVIPFTDTRTS